MVEKSAVIFASESEEQQSLQGIIDFTNKIDVLWDEHYIPRGIVVMSSAFMHPTFLITQFNEEHNSTYVLWSRDEEFDKGDTNWYLGVRPIIIQKIGEELLTYEVENGGKLFANSDMNSKLANDDTTLKITAKSMYRESDLYEIDNITQPLMDAEAEKTPIDVHLLGEFISTLDLEKVYAIDWRDAPNDWEEVN